MGLVGWDVRMIWFGFAWSGMGVERGSGMGGLDEWITYGTAEECVDNVLVVVVVVVAA